MSPIQQLYHTLAHHNPIPEVPENERLPTLHEQIALLTRQQEQLQSSIESPSTEVQALLQSLHYDEQPVTNILISQALENIKQKKRMAQAKQLVILISNHMRISAFEDHYKAVDGISPPLVQTFEDWVSRRRRDGLLSQAQQERATFLIQRARHLFP